jgi:putative transposase
MQWLGTSYSRRFNPSNERIGHLFQGRFKNIVVENDDYLPRLSCYIHRNPPRAGIVERLADYPWSSYRFYGYAGKPPAWLRTESIPSAFGGDRPRERYRRIVRRYSEENAMHGPIYGSRDFAEKKSQMQI